MELLAAEGCPAVDQPHSGYVGDEYLGLDKGWVRPSLIATALGSYATARAWRAIQRPPRTGRA